ncbi:MAG: hypothetical protein DWP95_06890 [Proteobacteria bacterium]|nr:MAG: hypothetical protein DWP95_06890 [Pseudomonadota bacterium]
MVSLFRKIRQKLLAEGKTGRYLKYAIGEILLVVIGILIALQINNWNDARKSRVKELHYLQNIKSDLIVNIAEMQNYLTDRTEKIAAAKRILEHFEGKPLDDLSRFNADGVNIYSWQKFYQSNNTFQELLNSGNLAIISNDEIKNHLLDIEALYKKMKSEEEHFRFDTETMIYTPLYALMDLNPLVKNVEFTVSQGQSGESTPLPEDYFNDFLKSQPLKNGFVLTVLELNTLNAQMQKMINMSQALIEIIALETNSRT